MLLVGDNMAYWGTEILLHVDHDQRGLVIFCGHLSGVLYRINVQSKLSRNCGCRMQTSSFRSADAIRSSDKISSYQSTIQG